MDRTPDFTYFACCRKTARPLTAFDQLRQSLNKRRSAHMERMTGTWYCYLALCADKSLYCGVTVDIERRMQCHNKGQGAKYTRSRRPVELFCARLFPDKCSAMRAEACIKRVSASKKPEVLHELALNAWKQHVSYSGV